MSSITTPLYQLVQYQSELERLADSGDIPPEEVADTLNALEGDIQAKAVQVAAFTRNLDATADAIRDAAKAMLERADRVEKRADAIRSYLLFQMQAAEIQKIESPWFVLAVKKNPPSIVIEDEHLIPPQFMVQPEPPPMRPDKKAIAAEFKSGRDVPGARVIQGERLEIK